MTVEDFVSSHFASFLDFKTLGYSLSVTTLSCVSVAALVRSSTIRTAVLEIPARIYVYAFHDPLPPPPKDGGGECLSDVEPISVLSHQATRPAYLSHSPWSQALKALFGRSEDEKTADSGLQNNVQTRTRAPWIRICDFAAEAEPTSWIQEHELNSWRRLSDDAADQVLRALRDLHESHLDLKQSSSSDPLTDIFTLGSQGSGSNTPNAGLQRFVSQVNQRPPPGAGAISESWYAARDARRKEQGLSGPPSPAELQEEYLEEARVIRAGQQMFYKFVGPILLSLLHFSLAGGFSSPKIMQVLRQTGYLVPYRDVSASANGSRQKGPKLSPVERAAQQNQRTADRTWTRLLETTQFVLDVMQDVDSMLPPTLFADEKLRSSCYPQSDPNDEHINQGSTPDSHSLHNINSQQREFLEKVGGGRGWQSSVRVRLLHANVRARILASVKARKASSATMFDAEADAELARAHELGPETPTRPSGNPDAASYAKIYDEAMNGVPINQEDLLATLASFSSSPLWCLGRMGHIASDQEREDYVALWRHVGFYMGIDANLLKRCFGSARKADGFLFNVVGHLFPNISQTVMTVPATPTSATFDGKKAVVVPGAEEEVAEEAQEQDTLASLAILQACADRPPFRTSLQTHWALARHLLGHSLASYLGIPRTAPLQQVSVDLSFFATRVPIMFGSGAIPLLYSARRRERWEHERLRLGRIMMRRLINWLNDGKLATFAGRRATSSGVEIELKAEDGKKYAGAWRMLMLEMVGVLVGSGAVFALGTAGLLYIASSHL
ncbi:hypothetical protein OC846_001627 [Tilletia horrida]|uniref:ER-bound oxygenase mpaB/mpaB'/Rubber oxygenase catalytic domain-containing protein n=1 Tax=Tilletia horrida TaxID=155126 RepID=A0AAN6JSU9_9BASI|nr:hypothetical protein OC846_001627 [Tilletia horrida]KAK0568563.1 hypothetical protein OC861_001811 [Tilletia horrida]